MIAGTFQPSSQLPRVQDVGQLRAPVGASCRRSTPNRGVLALQIGEVERHHRDRCASDATITIRAGADATSSGRSSSTSRKWPRWFTPNINSKPSAVSRRSGTRHAGVVHEHVQTVRSRRGCPSANELADLSRDRRGAARRWADLVRCPWPPRTSPTTRSPSAVERAVNIDLGTRPGPAPRTVARPIPVVPPVTNTRLPADVPRASLHGGDGSFTAASPTRRSSTMAEMTYRRPGALRATGERAVVRLVGDLRPPARRLPRRSTA